MIFKEIIGLFGFRAHKLRAQHFAEYFFAFYFPFEKCLAEKNIHYTYMTMIAISFYPKIIPLVLYILLLNTNKKIIKEEVKGVAPRIEKIILAIQLNHLQSLKELIEEDPELVYEIYKKKSILQWCSHYKNAKAHSLVLLKYKLKYEKTA